MARALLVRAHPAKTATAIGLFCAPFPCTEHDVALSLDMHTLLAAIEWYKLIIRAADEGRLDKMVEVLHG